MPYAPGIQDISGQLIAQGMSQAGAARARAIESIGESIAGGMRQYQQNQLFTNQALGKFGSGLQDPTFKQYVQQIVNDDPNAPQVPEALKKAFKNAQAGKVDIYDAALLGSAAESYQQDRMKKAQAALVMAQTEDLRAEQARRRAVAQMLGLPDGSMGGEVPAGAPAPALMAAPAAEMLAQAPAAPRPAMAPAAGVQAALGAFDPSIADAAKREAALKFLTTGQYNDPSLIAQRLAAEQRKQAAEEREMSLDEAKAQSAAFNAAQREVPVGQRQVAEVSPTTRPGYYALNIKAAEPTPLERQQMEAGTQAEKDRIARIGNTITEDQKVATADRLIAPAVGGLSRLLSEGKLDGDALEPLRMNIRSFAKGLNLPVDETRLAEGQQAVTYFGQLVLPMFAQTKGAISDKETALFQSWSPQLALSAKANAELLNVIDRRIKLGRKLEELGNEVNAGDLKPEQYVRQRSKLLAEYDASIPTVDQFRSNVGAAPQTVAEGLKTQAKGRQSLGQKLDSSADALYNKYVRKK